MPTSQAFVGAQTPLGANLVGGGAMFRTWAPGADDVFVLGDFNGWAQADSSRLVKDASGYWAGFVSGVEDGSEYKFFVVGKGSSGFKRDPYAARAHVPARVSSLQLHRAGSEYLCVA